MNSYVFYLRTHGCFSTPDYIHWEDLDVIYNKCRMVSVSFDLGYSETEDAWAFRVSSVAPSEQIQTRHRSFYLALYDVLEWVNRLHHTQN